MSTAEHSSGRRTGLLLEGLVLAGAIAVAFFVPRPVFLGDTACSRLATVYSLSNHGSWYIDRPHEDPPNPFEQRTIDKVAVKGRFLSSKPPILPLAMTGEYLVLHRVMGWDLDNQEALKPILTFMTLSLVGLPYLIGVFFFALALRLVMTDPWRRAVPLFALAFATQYAGFATQLNNHVPATAALIVAMYLALSMVTGHRPASGGRMAAFGFTAALVFTLDMPATAFVAVAGLYLLWRFPRQAFLWGGLGAILPLAIHFGIMMSVTGSPLPVQMDRDLYLFEGSYWRSPGGLDALNEPKGIYLFHMTFGRYGVFLLFPILLFGAAGFVTALTRRETAQRGLILGAGAAFAVLTCYYVTSTNSYGGAAYGFRWYICAMPVLLLMGTPHFGRLRSWRWALAALLLAISLFSAWEAYRAPWGESHEWTCRWLFGPSY